MQARWNAQMSQHPLLVSTIGWAVFGLCCVVLVGYAIHGLALVWHLIRQLRVDEHGVAYVLDAQDRVINLKMFFAAPD
jgi:hypothetical protein